MDNKVIDLLEIINPDVASELKFLEQFSIIDSNFLDAHGVATQHARHYGTPEAIRSLYLEFLLMGFDAEYHQTSDEFLEEDAQNRAWNE